MNMRNTPCEDTLKKRYSLKLSANLIGLFFNLITQTIIPRGLGPKNYGDFNYLTNFFAQVTGFLDMGTSACFYTRLSQRPKEHGLVSFYLYYVGIISAIVVVLLAIMYITSTYNKILPGEDYRYICMAAVVSILIWLNSNVLGQMADGYGITVLTEKAKILQKTLGLLAILVLFYAGQLHLTQFFIYNYLILLLLSGSFIWVIGKSGFSLKQCRLLDINQIKMYLREFYTYSRPLFFMAVISLIADFVDRWLLQYYRGSAEQGLYSLSYQIGGICLLFTGAMIPLITREYAIAFGNRDIAKLVYLFERYNPVLYSVAAYFSCFVALQADRVVAVVGGAGFRGAVPALTIMAFYPIHQTYGQLSGSLFFASGQTRLYSNISNLFMIIGLPISYFLLAPSDKMGINAGAAGLAMKMLLMNIIGVNIKFYYIAKKLSFSFSILNSIRHQIISVACMLGIAAVANVVIDSIFAAHVGKIGSFIFAGVLYTAMSASLAYFIPAVYGLREQDMDSVIHFCMKKIRA